MVKVIIDRIEGEMAVAEISEGKFVNLPMIFIPDASEGDCVEITTAKVSRFYFASIDDGRMTVLTPDGKYAMPTELMGEAKPGDPIVFNISRQETEKRKGKVSALMEKLFEDV